MDHGEIIAALRKRASSDSALNDDEVGSLHYAVRTAFEFDELLKGIQSAETVTADPTRSATILSKALAAFDLTTPYFGLRPVAKTLLSNARGGAHEEIEWTNETIVSGDETFPDLQQLAEEIAGEEFPVPLKWPVYPSVLELKREFADHFRTLRSPDANPRQRVRALLNTTRLQLTFFANTFCEAFED
jgi:hypothetical protein